MKTSTNTADANRVGSTGGSAVDCRNCANLVPGRFIHTSYGWGGYNTRPYWACAFDGPKEEAQCPHYASGDELGTCKHGLDDEGFPTDECFCFAARIVPIPMGAVANGHGYRQRMLPNAEVSRGT